MKNSENESVSEVLGKEKLSELIDSFKDIKGRYIFEMAVDDKAHGSLPGGESYLFIKYSKLDYYVSTSTFVCWNREDYQHITADAWIYEKAGAEKIREVDNKAQGGERIAFTRWQDVIKFNSLFIQRCLYEGDSAIDYYDFDKTYELLKKVNAEMDDFKKAHGNYTPRSTDRVTGKKALELLGFRLDAKEREIP